jgi:hypothetical protein
LTALLARVTLGSIVILLALVAALPGRTAGAGTVDQALTGNPGCSFDEFPAGVGVVSYLAQEFVPSMPAVTGADVCIVLHSPTLDPSVEVSIRRGTFNAPGEFITTKVANPPAGLGWFHVDFDPVAVTPGEKYVLQVTGRFGWQISCYEINSTCDHLDGDLYPPGETNFKGGDHVFRTYGSNDAAPPPSAAQPLVIRWADLDCSQSFTAADALVPLALAAGVQPPVSPAGGNCPAIGQNVTVFDRQRQWADVDCLPLGAAVDALKILIESAPGNYIEFDRDIACPRPRQHVLVYT